MNHHETIEGVHDALTVRRPVGDPVTEDGVTVIPVAVRGGWGGAGGPSGGWRPRR